MSQIVETYVQVVIYIKKMEELQCHYDDLCEQINSLRERIDNWERWGYPDDRTYKKIQLLKGKLKQVTLEKEEVAKEIGRSNRESW